MFYRSRSATSKKRHFPKPNTMKSFIYYYLVLILLIGLPAQAVSSFVRDRKLPISTVIYPSDSILKHKPQNEAKARIPGAVSLSSAVVAVIYVFAGATVGAIDYGALAVRMGFAAKSCARKLTKSRTRSLSASPEIKTGAKFGMIVGVMAIVAALTVGFYNAIMSWGG